MKSGDGNRNFGPNDPIIREQLAVMLWQYADNSAVTNKALHFNDTDEIRGAGGRADTEVRPYGCVL